MLLPVTTTTSPCTDGPPHGLTASGASHSCLPVFASRQYSERAPTFSLSRKADATSTLPSATATGASTCHFVLPTCQATAGDATGRSRSVGGWANSSPFFFASSYFF